MTYSYIFFLGSHPTLSRLEVLAVLSARGVSPTVREETEHYMIVETAAALDEQLQDILGGSDRFALELGRFPNLPGGAAIGQLLSPASAKATAGRPTLGKKVNVGLSGLGVNGRQLRELGESLKEWRQAQGGSLRYVVPQGKAERLNAAQVMAHKLDRPPHAELTLVRLPDDHIGVFRTVAVQDIGAYELRDTKRPYRDAAVGLLPPKLAQLMLNLAAVKAGPLTMLDPFCGMGTVLQEGWLADHTMVGSDTSERMIRSTEKNLDWLRQHFNLADNKRPHVFVHQANTRWSKRWHGAFDAVVTEPTLGKPLKKPLPSAQLRKHINELGELYQRTFVVLKPTLKEGGRLVFILPAFRLPDRQAGTEAGGEEWQLFPNAFLDALARVGYSKVQLGDGERSDMLYARPQALVGRELTVWRKNA